MDEMFAPILTEERGCGEREDGGLYACCGLAPPGYGQPVENFVIDPPIPWTEGPFRGVQFHKGTEGSVDLIMWVGAENYPAVPDYVEEGRRMGFCKRIPTGDLKEDGTITKGNNDYSDVIPYLSRMVLVHPRAVVQQTYRLQFSGGGIDNPNECVPHITRHDGKDAPDMQLHHTVRGQDDEPCTFATWDLSALQAFGSKHVIDQCVESHATISTPSVEYRVRTPLEAAGSKFDPQGDPLGVVYSPGVFLSLPLGHFEYVNRAGDGDMPSAIAALLGDNIGHTQVRDE